MGRLLKNSKQDVEAARKLLIQARVHLDRIQETSKLGDTNPPGFFPKINSHQMGPAPPRPVKLLSQEDTWKHYHRLLDELLVACDAVKVRFARWPSGLAIKDYNDHHILGETWLRLECRAVAEH